MIYMELDQILENLALTEGADFYGVADLSVANDFIRNQGGLDVASYPLAISIGIRLLDCLVDRLPNHEDRSVAVDYLHHGYHIINQRLDLLASRISS